MKFTQLATEEKKNPQCCSQVETTEPDAYSIQDKQKFDHFQGKITLAYVLTFASSSRMSSNPQQQERCSQAETVRSNI